MILVLRILFRIFIVPLIEDGQYTISICIMKLVCLQIISILLNHTLLLSVIIIWILYVGLYLFLLHLLLVRIWLLILDVHIHLHIVFSKTPHNSSVLLNITHLLNFIVSYQKLLLILWRVLVIMKKLEMLLSNYSRIYLLI